MWEDLVSLMIDKGIKNFVEIGPGKTLSSFIKRISKTKEAEVNTYNVEDVHSFKQLIQVGLEV